uniref:Matrix remodeling associated 5 n=1 Tax=Paramormyrops kingsleyae TaxID=1676925 RepID=A0A3B3QBI1_9TELE
MLPDGSKVTAPYNSADNRVSLSSTGKLLIKAVTHSDSGVYYCIAKVKEDLDVLAFRLSVEESSDPLPGDVAGSPVNRFVSESISLPCITTGTPDNSKIQRMEVKSNGTLVIRNIQLHDHGQYLCTAQNQHGVDRMLVTLMVLSQRPQILQPRHRDVVVYLGNSTSLDCQAKGIPSPNITWVLPDRTVLRTASSSKQHVSLLANGTLYIQSTAYPDRGIYKCIVSNAGDYLCVARNKMGDDYVLLKVSVMMKPAKIEYKQLSSRKVSYGGALKVDCVASGLPNPEIKWGLPDGTLVNSLMQADDSGDYICYAENQIGKDEMKIHIKVVADSPTIRNKSYAVIKVPYGDSISMVCHAKGEPAPSITWYSPTNHIIPSTSNKYEVHNDGTLVIQKTQRYDSGNYTCTAQNAAGHDKMVVRLEILVSLPTINGYKGVENTVRIPTPRVTWFFPENVVLPAPYHGSRMTIHHNGTLDIRSPKKTDSVQMICFARNEGGEARLVVQLDVKDVVQKPQLKSPQTEIVFLTRGTSMIVNCSVEGHPTPEITWILPSGPTLQSGIRNPTDLDAGKYRCVGKNSAGHIERTVILQLGKRPEISNKHSPVVSIISGENLQIHCLSSGNTLAKLSWTLPSGMVLTRPQQVDRYTVFQNGTLVVQQASVYDRGTYACKVANEFETSSLTVPVIVIAYPPRIISGPTPLLVINCLAMIP